MLQRSTRDSRPAADGRLTSSGEIAPVDVAPVDMAPVDMAPVDMAPVDIAVVGGGFGGSLAATLLGRAGYRVALVDVHGVYPPDFRAEKVAGPQVAEMRRLGLLDALAKASTPYRHVLNVRSRRVIDRTCGDHYGILYGDMVRMVRAEIPPSVAFTVGRVVDIEAGPDRQRVVLSSGAAIEARLVVLATGLGEALRQKLGIVRRMLFKAHSVTFGFGIEPEGARFGGPSLTCYGEKPSDRIDYLTLFPLGQSLRGNLFTYRDHRDPWTRSFRQDPTATLRAAMPGLESFLGRYHVTDPVQAGVMDLYTVENYRRDGVVLVGDAFQTSCPATGMGLSRVLTDVDRLCRLHAPGWLATPGMGADKIAGFYDDPVKRASDAAALRASRHRRALCMETSLRWTVYRQQLYLRRRLLGKVRQLHPALASDNGSARP